MKLKKAIVLGLLMIFTVVGLAMGGQNDNRRRDRPNSNRMERRENGNQNRGNWRRKHRRRHRRHWRKHNM
jgi:hypothetical protein